jgi:hypothetical protein
MNEDKIKQLTSARKIAGGVRIPQRTTKKSGNIENIEKNDKNNNKSNNENNVSNIILEKIKIVNQKIMRMPDIEFLKLRDIFTKYIETLSEKLIRDSWENRNIYKIYRQDKNVWLFSYLFKNSSGTSRFELKDDIIDSLRTIFNTGGQRIILSFIDSIDAILVNPESFKKRDDTEVFDLVRFKNSLTYFGFNADEKITFTKIKSAYNELLDNLPIDNNNNDNQNQNQNDNKTLINEHYVFLRDNYETYLKVIMNSSTD